MLGTSKTSVGVEALSVSGFGVYARSINGTAMLGTSLSKHGVRGECLTAVGAVDRVAVPIAGVLGISNKANGVAGVARGSTGAGVLGVSQNTHAPALAAFAASASSPGLVVSGTTTLNGRIAATGDLSVDGDLAVTGMKSAAVPHPDGTHRLVYCLEAPEAWLEDFGEGSVTDGKGEVLLDPEFAGLCEPDTFHVFISEHGDLHMHVTHRGDGGFTVEADRALAALKGLSPAELMGTFSYRVVARRKDRPGVRLQPFVLPETTMDAAEPG